MTTNTHVAPSDTGQAREAPAADAVEKHAERSGTNDRKRVREACEEGANEQNMSFIVAMHTHAAVWVHEIYVCHQHRQRGVATWLMQAVAEGQHVELQVLSGEQGENARHAYRRMGLRTKSTRAKGTVYETASEGYELMYTERMVVRSGWEPKSA